MALARASIIGVGVLEKKGSKGSISYDVVAYDQSGGNPAVANFDDGRDAHYLAAVLNGQLGGQRRA